MATLHITADKRARGRYRYSPQIVAYATTSFIRKTLPASLKDDTVRMNDRNIYKKTGQMNYQTADPKAKASVFLFFPIAHFLKTILTNRKNRTFGFVRNTRQPFAKPKEPFFANAQLKNINSKIINWQYR